MRFKDYYEEEDLAVPDVILTYSLHWKTYYKTGDGTCFLPGVDLTRQLRKHLAVQPSVEFGVSSTGAAIGGLNFSIII